MRNMAPAYCGLLVFLFIFAGTLLFLKRTLKTNILLKEFGVQTSGKIILSKPYTVKGGKFLGITYEFQTLTGDPVKAKNSVRYTLEAAETFKEGNTITIQYLPDKPRSNFPASSLDNKIESLRKFIRIYPFTMLPAFAILAFLLLSSYH